MTALRLGIPSKGRLMDDTMAWFKGCGVKIKKTGHAREYAGTASGIEGLEIAFLQAGQVPEALGSGAIHLGVTGKDLIGERLPGREDTTALIRDLGFGHADLIVAVPQSWIDVETMADLDDAAADFQEHHGFPMRVATKYHHLAREFFNRTGLAHYRLQHSDGATEGAPAAGAAEIVVDITSSGETLRANHLKILSGEPILRSQAQLRASRVADWSAPTRTALRELLERIEARRAALRSTVIQAVFDGAVPQALGTEMRALGAQFSADGVLFRADAPKSVSFAVGAVLRNHGAQRVEFSEPSMIFGANSDAVDRVMATVTGQ